MVLLLEEVLLLHASSAYVIYAPLSHGARPHTLAPCIRCMVDVFLAFDMLHKFYLCKYFQIKLIIFIIQFI